MAKWDYSSGWGNPADDLLHNGYDTNGYPIKGARFDKERKQYMAEKPDPTSLAALHPIPGQKAASSKTPTGGDLMSLIEQAGFKGQAASTMYAIVMAESGGSATAHNTNAGTGDNSYGLAQINMLGSMGPERLKEYGLSSNDDLFDPLTNLKVAYKMSGGGTHWGDWSTYNSGAYEQFLGQSGAQVTNAGAGTASGASGNTGSLADQAAGALQIASSLFQSVPDLNNVLQEALAGHWDAGRFETAIQQTNWWKQNSDAAKKLIGLQSQDPAEYATQQNQAKQQVQNLASQLGVQLSSDQITSLANRYLVDGWDSTTLQKKVGKFYAGDGSPEAQAANYQQQLQKIYSDMGLPISQGALDNRVRQLLMGTQTIDTYQEAAKQSAIGMYPGLAAQLNAGLTVKDVADPYVQQMSNILEINPNAITLQDPLIKRALQGSVTTTGGKSTATSTPLYNFEDQLRQDPRWQFTDNAHKAGSDALLQISQDFGMGT